MRSLFSPFGQLLELKISLSWDMTWNNWNIYLTKIVNFVSPFFLDFGEVVRETVQQQNRGCTCRRIVRQHLKQTTLFTYFVPIIFFFSSPRLQQQTVNTLKVIQRNERLYWMIMLEFQHLYVMINDFRFTLFSNNC